MSKRIITTIVVMAMIATNAAAQEFTVQTEEGINMIVHIIGEEVRVGRESATSAAIAKATEGKVTVPATVEYNEKTYPVTSIGENAFWNCTAITEVVAPSCTYIGEFAFRGCTALTEVVAPSCTSIGESAFRSCTALTEVVAPSCTSIGESAFEQCIKLVRAEYPHVTTIGNSAFEWCSMLEKIDFPKLTEVGTFVFYNCGALTPISLPLCTEVSSHGFYQCTQLKDIDLSKMETIGACAFSDCTALEFADLSACTSFGQYAFIASGLKMVVSTNPNPADITGLDFLPKTIDVVLYIPEELADKYEAAGWTTDQFKGGVKYHLSDETTATTTEGYEMHFKIIDDTEHTMRVCQNGEDPTVPKTTTGVITVPETVTFMGKEYTVTEIGDYAFSECDQLTQVNLPKTVTLINAWAFGDCTSLTRIHLSNVENIYNYAFKGCTALNTIVGLNNATYIESGAFSGCTGLTTIILTRADAVANVNANMFKNIGEDCTLYIPRGYSETLAAKGWTTEIFKGGFVEIGDMKGDVDNDGEVTGQDASLIQQKVAGKISW